MAQIANAPEINKNQFELLVPNGGKVGNIIGYKGTYNEPYNCC